MDRRAWNIERYYLSFFDEGFYDDYGMPDIEEESDDEDLNAFNLLLEVIFEPDEGFVDFHQSFDFGEFHNIFVVPNDYQLPVFAINNVVVENRVAQEEVEEQNANPVVPAEVEGAAGVDVPAPDQQGAVVAEAAENIVENADSPAVDNKMD